MRAQTWLAFFFAVFAFSIAVLEINYRASNFHRHNVDYLVNEFIPSLKDTGYETIILGDSLAANTFNTLKMHPYILDLSSNQAISVAGNFFMLQRYLEKNSAPDKIFLFCIPMFLHNNLEQQWTYSYFETVFTRPSEMEEIKQLKPDLYAQKYSVDRYIESRKNAFNFASRFRPKARVAHTVIDEQTLKKEPAFMNKVISEKIAEAAADATKLKPLPTIYLEKIIALCKEQGIAFTLVMEPMPPQVNARFKSSRLMQYLLEKEITFYNINDIYAFSANFFKTDGIHIGKEVNQYYQNLLDTYVLDIY